MFKEKCKIIWAPVIEGCLGFYELLIHKDRIMQQSVYEETLQSEMTEGWHQIQSEGLQSHRDEQRII